MAIWKNLPDVVFGDIMMMIGLNRLEDLHICRQVSQSWNVMIAQMTKYKKVTIRKNAEILVSRIKEESRIQGEAILSFTFHHTHGEESRIPEEVILFFTFPESVPKIISAVSRAHHGLLGSVKYLYLEDVDLASVPAEHLASLGSCVRGSVYIKYVRNCDLISFLDNVKCKKLDISLQTLSKEETQALVRAMESGVEEVVLEFWEEVSLDIATLTQYNGQGKCRHVWCWYVIADRHREEVRSWARRINWQVFEDFDMDMFQIFKP